MNDLLGDLIRDNCRDGLQIMFYFDTWPGSSEYVARVLAQHGGKEYGYEEALDNTEAHLYRRFGDYAVLAASRACDTLKRTPTGQRRFDPFNRFVRI